jgi:hypothetical protein
VGNLVIHHAGYTAARAAIVWVPEKLSYEEGRNVVAGAEYSEKVRLIRTAAVYKVLPVAGSETGGGAGAGVAELQEGIRRLHHLYGEPVPAWVNNLLPGKYEYAWNHTQVRLHPPEDGEAYGDHEDIRVWVQHTLHLGVPYAGRTVGMLLEPFGAARKLPGRDDYGTDVDVTYTLTNQGLEDDIDVEQFPRQVDRNP